MSRFDYEQSARITRTDPSFTSVVMAAMRKADTHNAALLRHAFPAIWAELQARYNAPDGTLPSDTKLLKEATMTPAANRHVYMYQIPVSDHPSAVNLPVGAIVGAVGSQYPGTVCFWAESLTEVTTTEERLFLTVSTGTDVDKNAVYAGTVHDREYVWHLYEIPQPDPLTQGTHDPPDNA